MKLQRFIHNLKIGKYFGSRKFEYIIYVIEYQHRGLPHAHIVVKLENVPATDNPNISLFIDEHFIACIPILSATSTDEDRRIHSLVIKHMQHRCVVACNGCKKTAESICSKGFDMISVTHTHFDERGLPVYKRGSCLDLKTVPYNPQILSDWDGHSNVEYSNNPRCVFYLFNYLYKGQSKQSVRLNSLEDVPDHDEVEGYLKGRFLCAMDATWQILGYQTYPASIPAVRTIKVKTESVVKQLLKDNKVCDMLIYLKRPHILSNLTFTQLFDQYVYNTEITNANHTYYALDIQEITDRQYYLCTRCARDKPTITRIENLYITSGEIWFLRLICYKRPIVSFLDAYTGPNGTIYQTFQEAAIAYGFVKDQQEALECFRQAKINSTPSQLIGLFIIMMLQGFPVKCIYNDPDSLNSMLVDHLRRRNNIFGTAVNDLHINFQQRLQSEGRSLDEFGFKVPTLDTTELQRELSKYNSQHQLELYNRYISYYIRFL
jgi:hypothetical protein